MTATGRRKPTVDTLAIAQRFQDQRIAKRLPPWISDIHDMFYPVFVDALVTGLECRLRLQALWSGVEKIDVFAKRKLQERMRERYGDAVDIDQLYFRQQYHFISPRSSVWAGRLPLQDSDELDIPLITAALHNFQEKEARPGGQPQRNTLVDAQGKAVERPSAVAFAKLCRELDHGQQYQKHLSAILDAPAGTGNQDFKSALAELQRSSMMVDAFKAYSEKVLSWSELQMLIRLYESGEPGSLDGLPVVAKQLRAFGCDLQQIVVLDAIKGGLGGYSSKRVLVYIPADPVGPWCAADNLDAFARKILGKRLRNTEYRHFFSRFVLCRDRQSFFSRVIERVGDVADWATRDLDEHMKAYPKPLFEHLARARIAQIKEDAATLVAPVARIDRAVQEAHHAWLETAGWTLLGVAGLFVPAIGTALLAVMAWELLDQVFQSTEDWYEGDTKAALEHLTYVMEEVAIFGLLGAGEIALRSSWRRAAVVDRLVPTALEDGGEKLWNQDLAPFRSELPPAQALADERGILALDQRQWIEMDGHHYEVVQRNEDTWHLRAQEHEAPAVMRNGAGQWYLPSEQANLVAYRSAPPPSAATVDELGILGLGELRWINMEGHYYQVRQGTAETWRLRARDRHAPEVVHNGAGAWRLWSEQPGEWNDRHRMFRRLGGLFRLLSAEQIEQVMALHGLGADDLRGLHVYGRAPDGELVDTVQRVVLANRVRDLVSGLRQGWPDIDQALLAQARDYVAAAREDEGLADALWAQRRGFLQHLYDQLNPLDSQMQVLRRNFASLDRRAAEQVLEAASEEEREGLLETGQVPQRLAELARARSLRIRGARAFEALCFDTPQTLDLAQVVLRLLPNLSEVAGGPRWALFDGDGLGPLLVTPGDGPLYRLVYLDGHFLLTDAQGHAIGEAGELFQTLAGAFDEAEQAAFGRDQPFAQTLRASLVHMAVSNREHVLSVLGGRQPAGAFLAPLRLGDGRIGYPLSGGWFRIGARRPRGIAARVRHLYPNFDDQQIERWIVQVQDQGRDVEAVLDELDEQYRVLRSTLRRWRWATVSPAELKCRGKVRKGLIDCWRHLVPEQAILERDNTYMLCYGGEGMSALKSLPSLPEQIKFPHVNHLSVRSVRLEHVPDTFLQAFFNLRGLEITNCRLRALPLHPIFASQLQVLDLSGNRIVLNTLQAERISRCRSLVYLNLSGNPLYTAPSIADMSDLNTLLLRDTKLLSVPQGVVQHPRLSNFDIRDNDLSRVPADFTLSHVWRNGRVRIEHEQIDNAAQQRQWHEPRDSLVVQRLRWQDFVDPLDRDDMAMDWVHLESLPEGRDFFRLVAQLTRSEGFAWDASARDLANRVSQMLEVMRDNPDIRQELFSNALARTCQDNATLCFHDLEIRVRVWDALSSSGERDAQALLALAGQLWRLERLDQFAYEHAQRLPNRGEESIEALLAFRLELNGPLDLHLNRMTMAFRRVAGVTADDVEQARLHVQAHQLESALVVWIVEQPFWKNYLSEHYPSMFEVPDAYHTELERLIDTQAPPETISRLQEQIDQREQQLRMDLTRKALRKHARDWQVPITFDLEP
ncbi:hypothetical protein K8374_08600 [Pseudomonas sp. p1(2021b)]|uniref:NEL-type E3 ubiquitin ligase domain-containing protein n=1 Tax=Pseudomonas sp. p1(2021b) TaxID=2874628 RepID=UPI001CCE58EA|nr:NEL-type E3 ubiquitin ligase domain-containing protein [Pseudomonas sp. p1(2021b)]UBM27004.1 hypothetical protein K8374_08600 [Pseudomonas sp. p1(2021b)]